jgi:hypothetical protein
MKPTLILLTIVLPCFLIGCAETQESARSLRSDARGALEHGQKLWARVTYYGKHEDRFGSKVAQGGRAKEGVTVAASPKWHFGQPLRIPALAGKVGDGNFTVQDRGTAVTRKKASYGSSEVFDVYLDGSRRVCARRMNLLSHEIGLYTEVIIPQ